VPGIDWGFCGLDATYREETIREDDEHLWKRRTWCTTAGDFVGVTRHRRDELVASDFHWEQRYVHRIDDLARLADAMGMRAFRELVVPYDREMYGAAHARGGKVRAHCHGNCMGFLETMAEIGIDSVEPLEEPPFGDVTLAEAKRRVGDRMLLSGNVASNMFARMTNGEVREAVRRAVRDGAPGGGFSLRTTGGHAGTNAVKSREQMVLLLERVEAYIDAALVEGRRG